MIIFCFLILSGLASVPAEKCLSRDYGHGGTVCVCNANHCDTVDPVEKVEPTNYLTYTSNKDGLRFEKTKGTFDKIEANKNQITITPDTYQEILGWGGAFTDSTGINIKSLDEIVQEKLMRSYFSEEGIEYSLCRVPVGGTDFSTRGYSYQDEPEDATLSYFALVEEDYKYKIPLIHQAINLTKGNLNLFASTWTAPKWMKVNGAYSGMFGFLKDNMYQAWATYFIKFLDAYKEANITFWAITTGNEPNTGLLPVKVPAVAWLPSHMRSWILNNLGPSLRNSSHSHIKLMAIDDQRISFPGTIEEILKNEDVKNYVDGFGVHWYMDDLISPNVLTETHDKFPDKFILGTEASIVGFPHAELGTWSRAEKYASSIIEDVNHWVSGWTDWNMALDVTGGPTFINNFLDSTIIVNATAGEFYKQPMFYAIGHFSKFVPRGSLRLKASQFDNDVHVTAFRRPDGGTVVVILNKKRKEVTAAIADETRGEIKLQLTAHSLTSVLYW